MSRLVERGGSQLLEAKDRTGARPIHKAAANGHSDVVNRLVDLNAEVGAANSLGNTPVHFAAMGGHWGTVRALLSRSCAAAATNKRGLTALELARKRGFQIPADVAAALEGKPVDAASAVAAADEDGTGDDGPKTLVITHPLCLEHKTCEKIERDESERPPENVCRLRVLVEPATGALRMASLEKHTEWCDEGPRVHIADVLRVHEYAYIKKLQEGCARVEPGKVVSLDGDTTVSRESFVAAMHAAGSVCAAVDRVCGGCNRNAFCAIRPPGHHAGYRGLVECEEEKHGSVGFCLLNNVAIGAAYARNVWRDRGIERVAIIDFDVHHGNGTEDCVRNLVPTTEEFPLSTPFSDVVVKAERYRPWLGEDDVDNVLFVSTHGYGRKMEAAQPGPMFYPGTGCTAICDVAGCPPKPFANLFGGLSAPPSAPAAAAGESKIINFGFALLSPDATPGTARLEWRDAYRRTILPKLAEFNPDLILISAGFDAHKKVHVVCCVRACVRGGGGGGGGRGVPPPLPPPPLCLPQLLLGRTSPPTRLRLPALPLAIPRCAASPRLASTTPLSTTPPDPPLEGHPAAGEGRQQMLRWPHCQYAGGRLHDRWRSFERVRAVRCGARRSADGRLRQPRDLG